MTAMLVLLCRDYASCHSRNLGSKSLHSLKRSPGSNAIHQKESLSLPDPLIPQRSVLLCWNQTCESALPTSDCLHMQSPTLTGSIQHFQHARLIINHRLLSIAVFNCRIVCLQNRQGGQGTAYSNAITRSLTSARVDVASSNGQFLLAMPAPLPQTYQQNDSSRAVGDTQVSQSSDYA